MSAGIGLAVQATALALWLGAALLLATTVAPAAFAALPTRAMAGDVVGRIFPVVFWTGIAAGTLAIAIELRAPVRSASRVSLAALVVIACAAAHLVVGARIARLRDAIGGPIDSLHAADARRALFGRLHGLSVLGLGLAMLAAAVLLLLTLRAARPMADRATPSLLRQP